MTDMFPETRVDPTEDSNQRFTTPETLKWCMETAGVSRIDEDVAACQEAHAAPRWFGWHDYGFNEEGLIVERKFFVDGLGVQWRGVCWLNPPWDNIEPWIQKAWLEVTEPGRANVVLALLPQGRTHRPWWSKYVEPVRDGRGQSATTRLDVYFPPFRPHYGHPGNPRGVGVAEPNFGSVLLVFRRLTP